MLVYRIAKEQYIRDLTGTGAKLVGARWNFKGVAVLYTSSSISLSVLESLAHFPIAFAPKDMALAHILVPDDSIYEIKTNKLPKNWRAIPSPRILKQLAYQWIKKQEFLMLKVPSVIIPQEFNYIINPSHKEFLKIKFQEISSFNFDHRIV